MDSVIAIIEDRKPHLTKKQRLVAETMLEDPESMSFLTLKELARKVGVSEMTVLHCCEALGFKNYNDVKYEFRRYVSLAAKVQAQVENAYRTTEIPEYEHQETAALLAEMAEEERQNFQLLFQGLDLSRVIKGAEMILAAQFCICAGRGVSLQAAQFMSMRLAIMGLPSVVMDTENFDSLHATLPLVGRSNLLVAFSLPNYYMMTTQLCNYAARADYSVLGISDSDRSPIAPYCTHLLNAPSRTRMFLNTVGPLFSLINVLTTAVNLLKSKKGRGHADALEKFRSLFKAESTR